MKKNILILLLTLLLLFLLVEWIGADTKGWFTNFPNDWFVVEEADEVGTSFNYFGSFNIN